MGKKLDLTGKKFGRLTVLRENGRTNANKVKWECQCDCGNISTHVGSRMKNGDIQSCGCMQLEAIKTCNITHGMSYTREYNIWQGMKDRCINSENQGYEDYGGRGISVCTRWLDSFENFYEDMGLSPTDDHSIDRIDNEGNYCPDNCRWATIKQQSDNKRPQSRIFGKISYMGVSERKGKYISGIKLGDKVKHLGTFDNAEDAARAYDKERIKKYGKDVVLNFPEESNIG